MGNHCDLNFDGNIRVHEVGLGACPGWPLVAQEHRGMGQLPLYNRAGNVLASFTKFN